MAASRKEASTYLRAGRIFLQPDSFTLTGLIQADEPVGILDEGCADEELGEALKATLRLTRHGLPPPDWKVATPSPILEAAGVKSWTAFAKRVSHVSVSSDDCQITLAPMRNLGGPGRFLRKKGDPVLTLPANVGSEVLGKVLREAFSVASTLGVRQAAKSTKRGH